MSALSTTGGLSLYDEFAGAGGSTSGAAAVPYVEPIQAANHNPLALETHGANHPGVDHILGDVIDMDITRFARADIFWASPACPPWTDARGKKRDFDKATWQALPGMPADEATTPDEQTMRARKLMEEIPRYLAHWAVRGQPVLCGVVENVIQCRKWAEWGRWLREIQALGYSTRVIALNSMHAEARVSPRAPQSRDRLYVAYWLTPLGRSPDWDKWLRPRAHCPSCDRTVQAMQVFKKPGNDMGRYGRHGQYLYKCPSHACRGRLVEPAALAAATAIDWSIPGTPIGERAQHGMDPLADATLARIRAGLDKYAAEPMLVPTGGTWRTDASPLSSPMPTRTTRENDGLAAFDPFVVPMRGGGDKEKARHISEPLHTVTAGGNHHGLAQPPGQTHILVPYYKTGTARPVDQPVGTFTTRDRWSLASTPAPARIELDEVLFRMLEPHEIQRGMAFPDSYVILGSAKRDRVRQLGNAVTPPAAEVIVSALVEAVTGEQFEVAA